jgi:nucleoid-associated protein YgaU
LTAGAILTLGFVLAWPFRKSASDMAPPVSTTQPPADTLRANNGDPIAAQKPTESIVPVAPNQVAAQMASIGPANEAPKSADKLESFDIANHPALVGDANAPASESLVAQGDVPPAAIQPAYDTTVPNPKTSTDEWPAELVHVVTNGDTLEKLAERYLGDAGRALEIFDLNRDQLSNPHLLPIGVELRVPRNPDRIID